jgi:hypothetical protein
MARFQWDFCVIAFTRKQYRDLLAHGVSLCMESSGLGCAPASCAQRGTTHKSPGTPSPHGLGRSGTPHLNGI